MSQEQTPFSEIYEMEGMDKRDSTVRQLIIRVSDQLKAGEIPLIDCTPRNPRRPRTGLTFNKPNAANTMRATKTRSMPNAGQCEPQRKPSHHSEVII